MQIADSEEPLASLHHARHPASISVIAPIALAERNDEVRKARATVNSLSRTRLRILLRSFLGNLPDGLLAEFLIVCPDVEVESLRAEVRRNVQGFPRALRARIRVQSETDMLVACGFDIDVQSFSGWVLQQVIKLGYARLCPTEYYLTMDSDIITLRPVSTETFFSPDGRGKQGMETRARYAKLYTADIVQKMFANKMRRFDVARDLLGAGPEVEIPREAPSETPTLLCAEAARRLLDHLDARHGPTLAETLRNRRGWTEYSLYYGFLSMTGLREQFHAISRKDVLLSLGASPWRLGHDYLNPDRQYTRRHFQSASAPFVAVQSWLPPEELLKGRDDTIEDFYADLEAWFAPSPSLTYRLLRRIRKALHRLLRR